MRCLEADRQGQGFTSRGKACAKAGGVHIQGRSVSVSSGLLDPRVGGTGAGDEAGVEDPS